MRSHDISDTHLTDNPAVSGSPIQNTPDNPPLSQGLPTPSIELIATTGTEHTSHGDTDIVRFNEMVSQLHAMLDYDIANLDDLREFLSDVSDDIYMTMIIIGQVHRYVLSDL
jgi:hypothetical protein